MSLAPSTPQTTRPSEGYTNGVHTGPSYVSGVNGVQHHSMDRGATEYSQPGLHSPHSAFAESQSEKATVDHSSAAQYNTPAQDARPPNYSSTSTPNPEYAINPSSARSGTFPEYIRGPFPPEGAARYHPSNSNSGSSGGMAQTTSPSLPLADGRENSHHDASQMKSDPDVPIDPNIAAATSPTYPPAGPQYSPYPPQAHDMAAYQGHQGGGMYAGRPEWGPHGYGPPQHPHGLPGPYGAHPSPTTTVSSASSVATAGQRPGQNHPLSQVYSFVPIPGAQQHKRPRRRYEEIERMYKCGWNGCEKAYGTLNHLNAHVTMQSHGTKRTPEEFKEIRKEWKARKKEEDNQRKADEERQRAAAQANPEQNPADGAQAPSTSSYAPGVRPQLPPIAYQPGQPGPVQGHYQAPGPGMEQMQQPYSGNPLYPSYPPSPYGPGNQMYQQHPDVPPGQYQQ